MKTNSLLWLLFFVTLFINPFVFASGLEISDLDVEVDGEADDNVDTNGGSFEAAPGDSVYVSVEAENTFSADSDNEIRNIDVSLDVEAVCPENLDDDIEEEIRIDDLDPTADDSASFRFTVPDCADEDNYDLDIRVEGKDDNDVKYVTELTLIMTIDKEPSEVTLEFFEPEPALLLCGDFSFSIAVESHNIGSLDEDAGLLIINDDVGVNKFEFMDLRTGRWTDDDTWFSKTYMFTLNEDVEPGEYDLRAEVEYSNNEKEIKRYQTITVPDCEEEFGIGETIEEDADEIETPDVEKEDITTAQGTTTTSTPAPETTTEQIEEVGEVKEEKDEFFQIPVLAVALIVGLLILFVMLAVLMKRK